MRRYYLSGNDAFRLKLLLPPQEEELDDAAAAAGMLQNLRMSALTPARA